jgi:uncharacterized protein
MGYKEISIKLPTGYQDEDLKQKIRKNLRLKKFSFQIENKSLDARKKSNIHWQLRISVFSKEIRGGKFVDLPELIIPYKKRNKKAVVIGSGPAGFFSALVLLKAGFDTFIIERGSKVNKRAESIKEFEKKGIFNVINNFAFGEGGAGTFSDGKLTSRSKHISKEKHFVLKSYVDAGAPDEIKYMSHPHLGSDNLKIIVKNLREKFISLGGTIHFETLLEDLIIDNGKVIEAITSSGNIKADEFIIASGHSAFETYRMLIRRGIKFQTKNFAIGCRIEHPAEIINMAQWGCENLPGVKSAEYRLTSQGKTQLPVYTFCMCPGGIVVPATAYKNTNIVNGMSLYERDGNYANAACVAGINPENIIGKKTTASETLDWLENLEQNFFNYSNDYRAPFCSIQDFINKKIPSKIPESTYALGLNPAPIWDLLPLEVSNSIREGLMIFNKKIKSFDSGIIMGLESKTSAPIQALRDSNGLCEGMKNLYIAGEASGFAGGIISSAADGIKAAMGIIKS